MTLITSVYLVCNRFPLAYFKGHYTCCYLIFLCTLHRTDRYAYEVKHNVKSHIYATWKEKYVEEKTMSCVTNVVDRNIHFSVRDDWLLVACNV